MSASIDNEDWANAGYLTKALSMGLVQLDYNGKKCAASYVSVGMKADSDDPPTLTAVVEDQEIECSIKEVETLTDPFTIQLTVFDVSPEALALFYGEWGGKLDPLGDEVNDALNSAIPELMLFAEPCPVKGCDAHFVNGTPLLGQTITHLNDYHKWTREAIADWLDARPYDLYFK